MSLKTRSNAVIIGGGAAGLLTGALAAAEGSDVIIVEKNDTPGKKLRITGKGRCNLTNNCSVADFLSNVPRNGKFMYSSLSRFTPADTMSFFKSIGVPLKTERGSRVFPVSDKADEVVSALIRYAKKSGVRFIRANASAILATAGNVSGVITAEGILGCSSAVLCSGGCSYPKTGSDGAGYKIAASLGHTIIKPKPSLVPLCAFGDDCINMQGLSLRNVTVSVFDKSGKRIFSELGEILFTHFGVSGPLALSASAHMRDFENDKYKMEIDLKPGLDETKLDARILRDFEKYANRDFANALDDLASRTMIPVLVKRSGIPPDTKVHSVTREQRRTLVELFKHFIIEIKGPRPIDEAIITSGGVDVNEINPKTMESKLISGLYFAGEIIDVDAYTGGFNLQIAWSTANAAARALSAVGG